MPDVRKCAIYGCRSNSRDDRDLKFFNFPTRESPVYATWLAICHESAQTLQVVRRPYICSNHFHPWHVGFRRLATGAIPQLKLKAPPGFEEEERARVAEETAAQKEKERTLKLINDTVYKWVERAQYHPEFGNTLCSSRRELQRVALDIRNLLGATLLVHIDDYWLRKFRKSHLSDWDQIRGSDAQKPKLSLDLVELIHSIDPNAEISKDDEIAYLVEEEKRIAENKIKKFVVPPKKLPFDHCPPLTYENSKRKLKVQKRSFKETLEDFYGIPPKDDSNSQIKVKSEKIDDMSQDDDGCFDVDSEHGGLEVVSEPIVETYKQALEHLKPLEDFALREENYRVIGLLSTLEIIFKNQNHSKS